MCVHSDSFHVLLCTLCTWFFTRKNAFEDGLSMF